MLSVNNLLLTEVHHGSNRDVFDTNAYSNVASPSPHAAMPVATRHASEGKRPSNDPSKNTHSHTEISPLPQEQ
jgi:hypothetical protein